MYSLGAVCMATGGLLYGLMEQERAGKWDNDIQESVHDKEKWKKKYVLKTSLKQSQFLTNPCFPVTIVLKTFNLMTLVISNDLLSCKNVVDH